jgi:hypothetical protein
MASTSEVLPLLPGLLPVLLDLNGCCNKDAGRRYEGTRRDWWGDNGEQGTGGKTGVDDVGAMAILHVERLGTIMGASESNVDVLWGNEGMLDGGEVVVLAVGVIFSVPRSCTTSGTHCWSSGPPVSEAAVCLRSTHTGEQ